MAGEFLTVQPDELKFMFELHKQIACSVRLTNNTADTMAFKVKTTSPKKYSVRPNTGVILPQSFCEIIITMQAQREAPPDMLCKDKFLVQSVVVPHGTEAHDISPDLFLKTDGKEIYETKLKVVYASPPHFKAVEGEHGQATFDKKNGVGNGKSLIFSEVPNDANELKGRLAQIKASLASLEEERKSAVKLSQDLQHELDSKHSRAGLGKVPVTKTMFVSGFSLFFVSVVGLVGILIGYLMHRTT